MAESYRLWLQYETRTDDITVIVVHINGLVGVSEQTYCKRSNFLYFQMPFFSLVFLQQTTDGESDKPATILRPPVPQVLDVTGSESPSTFSWSSSNHRVRHDLSRARLRALESSLENGQVWVPPPPAHRKTWEEEVSLILHSYIYIYIYN